MRAVCFQNLGLPELAAGDAYKAVMLCEAILEGNSEWAWEGWSQYEMSVRKSEHVPVCTVQRLCQPSVKLTEFPAGLV
jgi:hypothetical protein